MVPVMNCPHRVSTSRCCKCSTGPIHHTHTLCVSEKRCMCWCEWDVSQLRALSWLARHQNTLCSEDSLINTWWHTPTLHRWIDPTLGWFKQHKFTEYALEKGTRYFWCAYINRKLLDLLVSVLNQDWFIQYHLQHASVLSCSLLFIYFQFHSQTRGLVQTLRCVRTVLHTHIQALSLFLWVCGEVVLLRLFLPSLF